MSYPTKLISIVTVLLLLSYNSYCQDRDTDNNTKGSYFIEASASGGRSLFRDMATSPLYYSGGVIGYSGGWYGISSNLERIARVTFTSGNHTNIFNNTSNSSHFKSIEIVVSHLYKADIASFGAINTRLGATLVSTTNIRNNEALMNNSFGIENISNLMFSAQFRTDISRQKRKIIDVKLFRINLNPCERDVAFSLNTGVLNFNYRPGYAYNYLPPVNGIKMNDFKDYKLTLNGYRIRAALILSRHLQNKNILRLSYLYDMYKAPGKYEPFSYGSHILRFAILFNYK